MVYCVLFNGMKVKNADLARKGAYGNGKRGGDSDDDLAMATADLGESD